MKKLILSILAIAILFTSCGEDPVEEKGGEIGNNILTGSISGTVDLDASIAYELPGTLIVPSGATLNIPAGTKITATGFGTTTYIGVLKGGTINISGTAANPVVMQSSSGESGSWGGLTICGDAETTSGVDATAEVGGFIYGGTTSADDSGTIKYLVLKDGGAAINADSEYNGLSLYAVGSGTTIENLAIINGNDDGVEFFGGSVSVTNLYLENNRDDSIDWTEGWNGTVTNTYVNNSVDTSTVVEADGANGNPSLVNLTAVGLSGDTALQFKKTSGATITGLNLSSNFGTDLDLVGAGSLSDVQINGADALISETLNEEDMTYTLDSSVKSATVVDITIFDWAQ